MGAFYLTVFAFWFAEWYARHDFKEYLIGFIYEHASRAIIRFIVLLVASLWAVWLTKHTIPVLDLSLYLAYSCAIFWLWFEYRFNSMLNINDPFYIGNTAWTDRTLRKLGVTGKTFFVFKITLLLLFFVLILLLRY